MLDLGSLVVLLRMNDEMSPALATAASSIQQFDSMANATAVGLDGNLTPALTDAALANTNLATKSKELLAAEAEVDAIIARSTTTQRAAIGVTDDLALAAVGLNTAITTTTAKTGSLETSWQALSVLLETTEAVSGLVVIGFVALTGAVMGLVDGLTGGGKLMPLLSDLGVILLGLGASLVVGVIVVFKEFINICYTVGEAIGVLIRWFSEFDPVLGMIASGFGLLRDGIGFLADWFRDRLFPASRMTYDELSKLPGVVDGVTIEMIDNAAAAGDTSSAYGAMYEEAAKLPGVIKGVTLASLDNTEALKALKWQLDQITASENMQRDTLNELGIIQMNADARLQAHIALLSSSQVATANVGTATQQFTAIQETLRTTTDFVDTSLQQANMAMDYSAITANNVGAQYSTLWKEAYNLANGYLVLGDTIINLNTVASQVSAGFGIMAEAIGTDGARTVAAMVQLGADLVDIWTNPNTGIVDKIVTSAIRIGQEVADAIYQTAGEDIVERVAYDWGVSITEELANGINDTANALFSGDRQAAEIFHLSDLLDAADGLNAANFDTFASKLHDVFSMLETGMFDSSQAITVLSDNWEDFVTAGIDGSGRLAPALIEIMDLTMRFAEELADPALATQFVDQWLVLVEQLDLGIRENFELTMTGMFDMFQLVADGLLDAQQAADALDQTWDTFVEEGTNQVTGLLDPALQQAVMSMRELGIESEAVTEYIKDQLHTVIEGLNERVGVFGSILEQALDDGAGSSERLGFVLNILGGDVETLQGEFDRLGVYTVATFGALISEGESLRDALDLVGDSLDILAQGEHVLGLESAIAVDKLLGFREVVKVNEDVFTSIDGIQKMMTGLANTGYLTQEVFSAFGADLTAQFTTLTNRGVEMNDALLLMQPSLQTLWELQHQFGFEVDAGTQAMLDQAEAAGIIGGAFQDVMEQIRDILLGIAQALGAEIPGYLQQMGDAASDSIRDIDSEYQVFLREMESSTATSVSTINDLWSGVTGFDLNGQTYGSAGSFLGNYYDYLASGNGRIDYFNPTGAPIPYDTTPIGTMGESCCTVNVGPVYVMDGTSPSIGKMFLRALRDMDGDDMQMFRDLVCEARC